MDLQLLLNPPQQQHHAQSCDRSSDISFIQETPVCLSSNIHSSQSSPSPSKISNTITEFSYNDFKFYNYSQYSASSSSSSISNTSSLLSLSANHNKKYPRSSSMSSVCSNKDTSIISSIPCQNIPASKFYIASPMNSTDNESNPAQSICKGNDRENSIQKNDTNGIQNLSEGSNTLSSLNKVNSHPKEDKNLSIPLSREFRLAKRRYYVPKNSATEIQRRTGSCRPQGRPFSGKLAGNFVMHRTMNALIGNLFNKDSIKCFILKDLKFLGDLLDFNICQEDIKIFANSDNVTNKSRKHIIPNKVTKQLTINSNSDVQKCVCDSFNCNQFKFVQVMRNSEGKILKIETKWLDKDQNKSGITMDYKWVKQNVIFPRYKANMKINLISSDSDDSEKQNFVIYTDIKMLIMDLKTKSNREHFFSQYKVLLILDSKYIIKNIRPEYSTESNTERYLEQNQMDETMITQALKSQFMKLEGVSLDSH